MPTRPLRACRQPGCPALVAHGACPQHGGTGLPERPWARPSASSAFRLRGARWRALRLTVLASEVQCYLCGAWAHDDDIVDHVVPLAAGGTDDRDNLRRCCRTCHARKTAHEAARARTTATR